MKKPSFVSLLEELQSYFFFFFLLRALSRKIDVLVGREFGGSGVGGGTGAVPSSLAGDLSQIRAAENNILNQLSEMRWVICGGEGVDTSWPSQRSPLDHPVNLRSIAG